MTLIFTGLTNAQTRYKCMLQMKNYSGEGAYVVASIVDAKGKYIRTLSVMGDEGKWYQNLKQWYTAQRKLNEKLDGITSASVSGGKREVFTIAIEEALMNKGNKIRFESVVEHGNYIPVELEIPLSSNEIQNKVDAIEKGYLRFAKLSVL